MRRGFPGFSLMMVNGNHAQATSKAKIKKWDLTKLKSLCTAKETTDKTKSQTRGWDKIFTNSKTDKVLISKISKQLIKDNLKTYTHTHTHTHTQQTQPKNGQRLE